MEKLEGYGKLIFGTRQAKARIVHLAGLVAPDPIHRMINDKGYQRYKALFQATKCL